MSLNKMRSNVYDGSNINNIPSPKEISAVQRLAKSLQEITEQWYVLAFDPQRIPHQIRVLVQDCLDVAAIAMGTIEEALLDEDDILGDRYEMNFRDAAYEIVFRVAQFYLLEAISAVTFWREKNKCNDSICHKKKDVANSEMALVGYGVFHNGELVPQLGVTPIYSVAEEWLHNLRAATIDGKDDPNTYVLRRCTIKADAE